MGNNELAMTWSLKELYIDFKDSDYTKDMARLDEYLERINLWVEDNFSSKENSKIKIEEFIKMQNELYSIYSKLYNYGSLTSAADVNNQMANKATEILQNKIVKLTKATVAFTTWIMNIEDIDSIIKQSPLLKEHEFYLKEIIANGKYMLKEEEELILSKMKLTGSSSWVKLQQNLTSNHMVNLELDGEKKILPLNVVKNMLFDGDGYKRKIAYEAELASYKSIEEPIASALNGIKGEVINTCALKGYESPLHYTLENSRITEGVLRAMLQAMKESLPNFRSYYKAKAQVLGHKEALPYYDIFAPVGKADKVYTYEEARDFVVDNFRTYSNKMADFALKAFNNSWIDAEPRKGKRGGAFCSNLHAIGESRILCTFTGSFKNVSTLAHELGHGYHGSVLVKESYLNSKYPMPIAETASIFCETIVRNAAIKNSEENMAFSILDGELTNCGQVIVDIYSRFLFEDEFFRRRKKASLSVAEINELMLWAEKEAYGEAIEEKTLNPYAWINKPHYYYAERNYYNFPYAFGLLFAKGLYSEYLKRGEEFIKEYDRLLSLTGKTSLVDLGKSMSIDLEKVDFWKESLAIINEDINKFIALANKFK